MAGMDLALENEAGGSACALNGGGLSPPPGRRPDNAGGPRLSLRPAGLAEDRGQGESVSRAETIAVVVAEKAGSQSADRSDRPS
jgi:hypothetical protein